MGRTEAQRAALVQALAVEALSVDDPAGLWPILARKLTGHFGCERVTLFQVGAAGKLFSRFAQGLDRPVELPEGGGLAGEAARSGRTVVSNRPYSDSRFFEGIDQATNFKTENVAACPLAYRGRVAGVVELINKPGGFSPEDVAELQALAAQIAVLFVKFRYEEEQAGLTRQLVQAEKMAAVGRLTSGLAHEVNNPLMAIMGFTSILLRTPGIPPHALEMLLKIDAEVRRVAGIVGNMLGFARKSGGTPQPVDLAKVAADCASLTMPEMRKRRVELALAVPAGLPPALGHADELKQVFLNLLLNAAHALDGRERARVEIRARLSRDGRRLIAEVADNGPGVPADIKDKIFEPFFSTKGEQGTGLGLYVSAGILERHGGALTLEDNPGGGALFQLELPAGNARAGSPK